MLRDFCVLFHVDHILQTEDINSEKKKIYCEWKLDAGRSEKLFNYHGLLVLFCENGE